MLSVGFNDEAPVCTCTSVPVETGVACYDYLDLLAAACETPSKNCPAGVIGIYVTWVPAQKQVWRLAIGGGAEHEHLYAYDIDWTSVEATVGWDWQ